MDYKLKRINAIPDIIEVLSRNKFTVIETEAFLSKEGFQLVMEYIFYFHKKRGDNERIKTV